MKLCLSLSTALLLCLSLNCAQAGLFYPTTYEDLLKAATIAGSNGEDDTINLGGSSFNLNTTLEFDADDGFGLSLTNGALAREDNAKPFRLVWFKPINASGAIQHSSVKIDNVVFSNGIYDSRGDDQNDTGGAAILFERDALVYESEFTNNTVIGNGSGGAVLSTANLTISKGVFVNNHAVSDNAQALSQGGAVAVTPEAGLYVSHSYFLNNSADMGGAVHAASNALALRVTRSTFDSNIAQLLGGGIWSNVGKGSFALSNVTFIDNEAANGGGAVYSQSNRAELVFNHLTLWGNRSNNGDGGGFKIFMSKAGGSLLLLNSILANNVGGNCSSLNGKLTFKQSDNNLFDDNTCGPIKGVQFDDASSILKTTLEYDHGIVPTLPILMAGIANDAVPLSDCLGFDARDIIRPNAGDDSIEFCDVGAYELVPGQQDSDSDTVRDNVDNCIFVENPLQSDVDADGKGDACDVLDDRDADDDLIANHKDNCPMVANFAQLDSDDNGIGDACDL